MGKFLDYVPEQGTLKLLGVWRLPQILPIREELKGISDRGRGVRVLDGSGLKEIDTASAMVLLRAISGEEPQKANFRLANIDEDHGNILRLVQEGIEPSLPLRQKNDLGVIGRIGEASINVGKVLVRLTNFFGETVVESVRGLAQWRYLRLKELFIQLESVGLDAIPIVALVTFLIGIVVAYLFGIQIQRYGANILIVDAVGLAMCRELSPILVAIILAGRSGSAFTAQIGTMKLNEEIDAMTTLGLSPMRVLVLPRVFALMVAMPLLVFVGDVVGILGAMLVADLRLGVTGVTFLERLHTVLTVRSLMVGLIKAPVFAAFIAVIGCQLGLSVENNARSVGINTTSTVVRSIVAVILLNAAFAIIFVELKI